MPGFGQLTIRSNSFLHRLVGPERALVGSKMVGSRPEVEVVLMITSADQGSTAEEAAGLTSVGSFELRASGRKRIHDVYFDTEDGRLRGRRMNLRVRVVDGERVITLKRSAGRFTWRRDERQELELPWSQESLRNVASELKGLGIQGAFRFEPDPVETMKRLGLVVLQDRETDRRLRDVASTDRPAGVLAELAIDGVVYHFRSGDLHLFELELEARSEEGRRSLEVLREGLRERLGSSVQAWKWGKLATGRVIERLLMNGELEGLVDGGRLMPAAFERIERALAGRG